MDTAPQLPSGTPPFPVARFTVEQYHRMIASGAFTEDDQLELIEGWVVKKMAKGPAHEYALGQAEELLRARLPAGWHIRNQAPLTLSTSEPEPDLAIVRGTRSDFRERHPEGRDVALVVEISDTTLTTDRLKARTYAADGVREYWIVNLSERQIEVHTAPTVDGFSLRTVYREGETIPLALTAGPIVVRELLD